MLAAIVKIVSLLHLESWCYCFDWGWGAVRFAVCEWHLLSWCTENHDGGKLLLSIFLFWAVLFCARNGKRTIHCSRGTLSNMYSDSKKKTNHCCLWQSWVEGGGRPGLPGTVWVVWGGVWRVAAAAMAGKDLLGGRGLTPTSLQYL